MELKRHLTYANVMATLGAFLAIAGGSFAIAAVPDDDSVDSQSVIDDSLKSRDLMNGEGVGAADVINGTLGAADIGVDAVGQDEIPTGAVGREEIESATVGSGQIATNAVGAAEIDAAAVGADEIFSSAVGESEIAGSAVGESEITDGAVDASEIGDDAIYRVASEEVFVFDPDASRNGDYAFEDASVDCSTDDRDGELIAGTAKWTSGDESEDELFLSEVRLNMDSETATAIGGSDAGGSNEGFNFVVEAICLEY